MDTCVCMAGFPRCSPETITTLLISNTPIQNKKFFVFFFSKKGSKEKKSEKLIMVYKIFLPTSKIKCQWH